MNKIHIINVYTSIDMTANVIGKGSLASVKFILVIYLFNRNKNCVIVLVCGGICKLLTSI